MELSEIFETKDQKKPSVEIVALLFFGDVRIAVFCGRFRLATL
jgi:hypothetical protein